MRILFTAPLLVGGLALLCTVPADARGRGGMSNHSTGLERLHALGRERGKLCMSDHYHFGDGSSRKSKTQAMATAKHDWAAFVRSEYGSAWAQYSLSGSRGYKCTRRNGQFSCSVSSRPCRR